MAGKTDKTSLGYLGEDFQYKLVHAFLEDKEFFKDLYEITDQNMFTNPNLKTCVGIMKEYFEKHESVPSYETIGIVLREKISNPLDLEVYFGELGRLKDTPFDDLDLIKELGTRFFRQQNIVKTANQILKIASDGVDEDKCAKYVELMSEALSKGTRSNFGANITDDLDDTLSADYRSVIKTGIDVIDNVLEGGIGKGELGVIACPTGIGKVQPYDAKIITPSGIKNMGDIKEGDLVIGRNGKPTRVIGVYPHKNWEFYKVTFSDGSSTECGKEHLWAVNSLKQRTKRIRENNKKISKPDLSFEVKSLDEILKEGLFVGKRHNFRIPICEPVEYTEREVKINPYIMGYLIGDGNFKRTTISVGELDEESVITIFNKIDSPFKFQLKENKNRCNNIKIYQPFKDNLKDYYDVNITSENKFIHEDYLYNSLENRIALLNGLMDSDGYCSKKGILQFYTKSKKLSEDFKQLIFSLGGFAKITTSEKGYTNKETKEYINCGTHYKVTFSIKNDKIPIFRLKRKQERVHYSNSNNIGGQGRYIDKVEYSRITDGQCILLESEDHLYLTDDYIVTHNTSLTTAMASFAAIEENKKVLQIFFEDTEKQIRRKHLARFVSKYGDGKEIEARNLSKPDVVDYVREVLGREENKERALKLKQNIKIVRLPSGEMTAESIKRFIKKLMSTGFIPELVIIDYFECLNHDCFANVTNDFDKEGKTMRKFEAMAGELNVAFWIPSQGTKDSINLELLTIDKMGGSAKKSQIAHIILSIAKTTEDVANNRATLAVLKNRAGQSGKIFEQVKFNNGTCIVEADDDSCDSTSLLSFSKKQENKIESMIFKKALH